MWKLRSATLWQTEVEMPLFRVMCSPWLRNSVYIASACQCDKRNSWQATLALSCKLIAAYQKVLISRRYDFLTNRPLATMSWIRVTSRYLPHTDAVRRSHGRWKNRNRWNRTVSIRVESIYVTQSLSTLAARSNCARFGRLGRPKAVEGE